MSFWGPFLLPPRGAAVFAPPPAGGNALQLPTPTGTVNATPATVEGLASSVAAGTQVRLASNAGNYQDLNLNVANGTPENPVVFVPSDKNDTIVLRGVTLLNGGNGQIWGMEVASAGSNDDRMLEVRSTRWTVAYCDMKPFGVGSASEQSASTFTRLHRCRFFSPVNTASSTGKSQIKYGFSASASINLGMEVDWCIFEGPWFQREGPISIKAAGLWMHDCQCNRNGEAQERDIAMRHARSALLERIRFPGGDIVVQGTDHVIRNCIVDAVVLAKGTDDGDNTGNGSSSLYLSAKRCVVQRITGDLEIGGVPFSSSMFDTDATDNDYSDVSGTVTIAPGSAASTGTAPTIAAETVPTLTTADVGPAAYRTLVTAAP